MSEQKRVGTLTTKVLQFKKARLRVTYDVYETQAGGVFTARVTKYGSTPVTNGPWGDPADTDLEACRQAYKEWYAPFAAGKAKQEEYYRSGGY